MMLTSSVVLWIKLEDENFRWLLFLRKSSKNKEKVSAAKWHHYDIHW